jgi:histidinol-phosphate aminotransferase
MIDPRPEVAALPRVVHGAVKDSELRLLAKAGVRPDEVVDFSVNSNPLGPSPRVREALAGIDVARYPDDDASDLRAALAQRFGVSPEQVLVANGSAELIWLVCLAYVRPGDTVAIFGPTFGEYERAARLAGGRVITFSAPREDAFRIAVPQALAWLRTANARIAFICNPNNPTGTYLEPAVIAALVDANPETLFIIDEAYAAFLRPEAGLDALLHEINRGNVLLMRSMTKDYAIAGLRLGYALAAAEVIDALARAKPPWSVSRPALSAGLASLDDEAHLRRSQLSAAEAVTFLQAELRRLGVTVHETRTNFLLAEVGDAARMRSALLREGLVVRDCTSFGLPTCIRIAARPLDECRRLVSAFAPLAVAA